MYKYCLLCSVLGNIYQPKKNIYNFCSCILNIVYFLNLNQADIFSCIFYPFNSDNFQAIKNCFEALSSKGWWVGIKFLVVRPQKKIMCFFLKVYYMWILIYIAKLLHQVKSTNLHQKILPRFQNRMAKLIPKIKIKQFQIILLMSRRVTLIIFYIVIEISKLRYWGDMLNYNC